MATRTRAVEAEASGELFEFEHDGKTYAIPPASKLKGGVLRKILREADNDIEQTFMLMEALVDAKTMAALEDKELGELNKVFTDWQQFSGVSMGK